MRKTSVTHRNILLCISFKNFWKQLLLSYKSLCFFADTFLFSTPPHAHILIMGRHVFIYQGYLSYVVCYALSLTLSCCLLQIVKKGQELLLVLLHFFKINGDIVHLQRSGTVLKLPKFYTVLEKWRKLKIIPGLKHFVGQGWYQRYTSF